MNQKEMEAVEPQPIIREERPSWERPRCGGFRGATPRSARATIAAHRRRADESRAARPPRRDG